MMPPPIPTTEAAANLRRFVETLPTAPTIDPARRWYQNARRRIHRIADHHGCDRPASVAAFAALSPGADIERNYQLLTTLLATGDAAHPYGRPVRVARNILHGQPPLDELGGNKVLSFYDNLARPQASTAVTIDRHAFAILMGGPTSDRTRTRALDRKGGYDWAADVYRTIADEYGVRPNELQAVTWHHWRDQHAYATPIY